MKNFIIACYFVWESDLFSHIEGGI